MHLRYEAKGKVSKYTSLDLDSMYDSIHGIGPRHDTDTRANAGRAYIASEPVKLFYDGVHSERSTMNIVETQLIVDHRAVAAHTATVNRTVVAPTTDNKPTRKQVRQSRRNGKVAVSYIVPFGQNPHVKPNH